MSVDASGMEVWFLTGSQELYGPEALEAVERQARRVAEELDAPDGSGRRLPARVVFKPVVTTPDSIRRVITEAGADDSCAGVIAWMHTFSPARMWISGLQRLSKPLLHLHTQFNHDLPWSRIDMDFMNLNQAAHGDREFAHILTRLGVPRKTVVGHWGGEHVRARLDSWCRAACGLAEARRLSVARFGDNMRRVAVTEGDKVSAEIDLGPAVNGYGISEVADRMAGFGDAEAGALVSEYEEAYDLVPELRAGGERRSDLVAAARIELALASFLEETGAGAFTDTFEDLGALPQLPGIAVQRLMERGYGFGAEGDWKTAILVRIGKAMARGLDGGTSFMEDYTYNFGAEHPQVLGAHMLEVCPSIASARPSCEIHPLDIGGKSDPVRLVFTAPEGPGTVVGLTDLGGRFRLVVNEVDVVAPEEDLPRLPVARAVWTPRPSLEVSAEAWMQAGAPHHTCFSQALTAEVWEDFARMAGVEAALIDGETSPRSFRRELEWSARSF
ncbi:L-arabinose isomerase [Salininema proteolyticum]|uniref:L-arabinose isomerase n=1 Tax=Salininema proteolyticum TaxID=1607685 RepID=A0ABV8TYF3_9ACTN